MCWACYTPLSGAAPASGGGAPGPKGSSAPIGETEEKQKIPPWQLAVIGIGLLFAIGMGVKTMMPSSAGGDDIPMDVPLEEPAGGGQPQAQAPSSSAPAPQIQGGGSVPPVEAPFKIVLPPNPRSAVATMAIVPTTSTTDGATAASYAAYVRRQYTGRARTLYIYVFSDTQSAQAFAKVMRERRGEPLNESDYSSLSSLWGSTLARYEYSRSGNGARERVLYPSKSPSGWWYGRS